MENQMFQAIFYPHNLFTAKARRPQRKSFSNYELCVLCVFAVIKNFKYLWLSFICVLRLNLLRNYFFL
jgi:hypothetical protein